MIKSKDLAAIKAGEMSVDQLLENYPVKALVSDLIEIVAQKTVIPQKPIALADEDYQRVMSLFRPKGIAADGSEIRRGRPRHRKGEGEVK